MLSPGVLWDKNSSRRIEETIVNFQVIPSQEQVGSEESEDGRGFGR